MLLCAWGRLGLAEARQKHAAFLAKCSALFEVASGFLAVSAPHVGVKERDYLEARPRVLPHPTVRVSRDSFVAIAGPLPQLPIYYSWDAYKSVVTASSDLAPLRAAVKSKLNLRRVVALSAGIADPWPGETVFEGIHVLVAGETLTVTSGGPSIRRTLPACGTTFEQATPNELAVALRGQLRRAVERATAGKSRVTVLVGGGLDSSGVLAIARESAGVPVDALAETWAAPGDDRPYLAALERHLGIEATKLSARDAAPWFIASLCADAQPQLWSGAAHDMMLWATARDLGADVTLGGYGGDIIFGGRPSFAPAVLAGHPVRAVRSALALRVPWSLSRSARLRSWVISPVVEPMLPPRLIGAMRLRRLRASWMRKPFVDLLESALGAARARPAPATPNEWMDHFASDRVLSELSMSWGAMSSVTHTVPVDVLRDVDLVRFVARVPPSVRNDGEIYRGLYRRALEGMLPEIVRMRNDKAAMEPGVAEAALAAGAVERLEDLGSLRSLADLGLVEPRAFAPIMARWMAAIRLGERAHPHPGDECWRMTWQLLSVEQFLRGAGAAG